MEFGVIPFQKNCDTAFTQRKVRHCNAMGNILNNAMSTHKSNFLLLELFSAVL